MSTRWWMGCLLFNQALLVGSLSAQVPIPKIIADINEISDGSGNEPGLTPGSPRRTASSSPTELCLVDTDRLWFAATSGNLGRELWRYNPSAASPLGYHDLFDSPEQLSSDPCMLTPVGQLLFLAAKGADGNDHLYLVDAGDNLQEVSLEGLSAGARIQDMAPMGTGAAVAVVLDGVTTFWQITGTATPAVKKLYESEEHSAIGDMIDCEYDGSGFLAFTSRDVDDPNSRLLAALSKGTPSTIHSGDVDSLIAVGTNLYFTAAASGYTDLYVKRYNAAREWISRDAAGINHLMPASYSGTQYLYFIAGSPGSAQYMWRYSQADLAVAVSWPTGVSVRNVTAATLVQGIPHVLGLGSTGATWFWAIWKADSSTTTMVEVQRLTNWSDCSQLAGNSSGKMAFVGRYDATSVELRSPHIGLINGATLTAARITDLRTGTMPSGLMALATEVVFVAEHARYGLEPWSCTYQ
jgi:hypothetical protein